jgi:hypothetical protein
VGPCSGPEVGAKRKIPAVAGDGMSVAEPLGTMDFERDDRRAMKSTVLSLSGMHGENHERARSSSCWYGRDSAWVHHKCRSGVLPLYLPPHFCEKVNKSLLS